MLNAFSINPHIVIHVTVLPIKKFRQIKSEIRILGIDDSGFTPRTKGKADIIGVVYRGGQWLDGIMKTQVEIDGLDATEKIVTMIKNSPHFKQIRVIMLDGVTFAGFNIADIKELFQKTELPVITVTREKPNFEDIKKALKNLPHYEERWEAMKNAGEIFQIQTREGEEPIHVGVAGISESDAEKILKKTSTRSNIPEALRVAHIIASGLAQPEEKEKV
jgi:endonuclease V-like protein UPF0215 family